MKTLDEFKAFIEGNEEINSLLQEVGKKKKSYIQVFAMMSIVSILFVGGVLYFSWQNNQASMEGNAEAVASSNRIIYVIVGICFVLVMLISLFSLRGTKKEGEPRRLDTDFLYTFKDKIIRKIIFFVDPSFRYKIDDSVFLDDLLTSGMLVDKRYDFTGSDLVWGIHEGVSFRFSNVTVQSYLHVDSYRHPKVSNPYIFKGSILIAEFNKQFRSPVFVYPYASNVQNLQCEGEEVRLESPEFMKIFRVYSPNQLEARYILSTSLMARIEKLYQLIGEQLHIIFANNHVYIANNNHSDRFDISWTQPVGRKELLVGYYEELVEQLSMIEELKLNIKIWS